MTVICSNSVQGCYGVAALEMIKCLHHLHQLGVFYFHFWEDEHTVEHSDNSYPGTLAHLDVLRLVASNLIVSVGINFSAAARLWSDVSPDIITHFPKQLKYIRNISVSEPIKLHVNCFTWATS